MPGARIAALVFDFDGLLMDTETTLLDSWQHEWRRHGLDLPADGFFADHGGDVSEQRYADLARAVGPGFDRAASDARRRAYRESAHRTLDLAPGIRAWFDQAAGLGLRLAVASSSPARWVRGNLERTGDLDRLDTLAYGDEVPAHKPDPAVYRLALHRLGVDPAEALAFEDTPHGVAAAQAAGMRCVAIPNRFTPPARFASADLLLTSATQTTLTQLLSRLPPAPAPGS